MPELTKISEVIRRGHCSHKDSDKPNHICVGECTITRNGVSLKCTLCGSDDESTAYMDYTLRTRVTALAAAFGVDLNRLTNMEIVKIISEVAKSQCSFCGAWTNIEPFGNSGRCSPCKAYFSPTLGWKKFEPKASAISTEEF